MENNDLKNLNKEQPFDSMLPAPKDQSNKIITIIIFSVFIVIISFLVLNFRKDVSPEIPIDDSVLVPFTTE